MTPPTPKGRERIGVDVDVLFGRVPDRHDLDAGLPAVRALLDAHGVDRALVCPLRGGLFDPRTGNDEVLAATAGDPRLVPVGTVDLRDPLGAEPEIERLVAAGVRPLRLFCVAQLIEPDFPALRHVAELAAGSGLTVLTDGDVRRCWRPFAGRGASVCFLDVHAYHVGDFVLLAREEPGFVASTRLLNAPDSIERVVGEVGAAHLAYGSRLPLHDVTPSALRLRLADLPDADWHQASAQTAAGWLGEP
ncbi:MAG: amidohydrolase family protein [Micromonosporaceae bacterium]